MYKRLKDAHGGVVGARRRDDGKGSMRIRSMRKVGFDRKWRELTISVGLGAPLRN